MHKILNNRISSNDTFVSLIKDQTEEIKRA